MSNQLDRIEEKLDILLEAYYKYKKREDSKPKLACMSDGCSKEAGPKSKCNNIYKDLFSSPVDKAIKQSRGY